MDSERRLKLCPACNAEYTDREHFCRRDGARLVAAPTPAQIQPQQGQPGRATPKQSPTAVLGVQFANGQHRDFPLDENVMTIGAAADNRIILDDTTVSRHHARIEYHDGEFVILDNHSTNGVTLNNKKLGSSAYTLRNGDSVLIGRTRMTFTLRQSESRQSQTPQQYNPPYTPPAPAPQPGAQTPPSRPAVPLPTQRPPQSPPVQSLLTPKQPQHEALKSDSSERRVLDGRYELQSLLGQDSLGALYRARRIALGDTVAVRVLNPALVDNAEALERFRRQALVAARIRHPNAVQIYDFIVSTDGTVYIVEELLSGRTLRDLIRRERGLTLPRVASIFNQICGAVHAAHLSGIVLRDLRPESIHLEQTPDGQEIVKVSNSGLAKLDRSVSGGVTMADAASEFGDARYMSPEQWQGLQLDSRADVYSLGVILFEMLTGIPPFDAATRYDIADQHINASIPDLAETGRPDLDESVNAVVSRALAKAPSRRPPTALHLAAEFEAVTGVKGGILGNVIQRATGILPIRPVVVPQAPAPTPTGETALPSVVAQVEDKGRGTFNAVVVALMAEAFLSRVSGGLVKTVVPLYALLVFGLDIRAVLALGLIQDVVPLLLRPVFGTLADRYGKKRIFILSLVIRTIVSLIYAFATLPILFIASAIRGIADSAKGPSASAMIADNTDEGHIAKAYSWYTTTKSTSGSIGESVALWLIPMLLAIYLAAQTANVRVAVIEDSAKPGREIVEVLGAAAPESVIDPANTNRRLLRVEERPMRYGEIPLDKLPEIVDRSALQRVIVIVLLLSTILSAGSIVLVAVFIKEKKKDKSKKKKADAASRIDVRAGSAEIKAPNIWAFALLGTAITAPGYLVAGNFFLLLAVKLSVTAEALFWIKIAAEMVIPLVFGPFFGWVADRIGSGKVLSIRSVINLITSIIFWMTTYYSASAIFGVLLGVARALDEIGKAAFKPTWGAVAAKVSSYNLANRSRTMSILETGVDSSDLIFPQIAGLIFQRFGLAPLMIVRGVMALAAEIYTFAILRRYKL